MHGETERSLAPALSPWPRYEKGQHVQRLILQLTKTHVAAFGPRFGAQQAGSWSLTRNLSSARFATMPSSAPPRRWPVPGVAADAPPAPPWSARFPLHAAACRSDSSELRALLPAAPGGATAGGLDELDEEGRAALHYAAWNGLDAPVAALLAAGRRRTCARATAARRRCTLPPAWRTRRRCASCCAAVRTRGRSTRTSGHLSTLRGRTSRAWAAACARTRCWRCSRRRCKAARPRGQLQMLTQTTQLLQRCSPQQWLRWHPRRRQAMGPTPRATRPRAPRCVVRQSREGFTSLGVHVRNLRRARPFPDSLSAPEPVPASSSPSTQCPLRAHTWRWSAAGSQGRGRAGGRTA